MTATENIDARELEAQIDDEQEVLDEGEVAADYLEELLDIADLDGDIDIEIRGGRTYISIVTEDENTSLGSLVGKNGEILDALQELTRLAVLTATGERSRLILDIAGYRADRAEQLKKLAEDAIASARETGEKVHLEPMSAYERKLVHDVIAEAGLHSESEGESTRRHIVISVVDS
ncbi:KH domain-containing protein [Glutamicibacter sp. JL.03c]|uniref:Jag family protein n=1 Tax=Glutamicibacter sp. JL.03c TaxID=2984842 RepID=UPI0021F7DBC5|nr:R3H domain-containing nucleic acid-binding protein [Glutamicibacter sp. JL.03c]UYQ77608.1 KH domain-containing protein [Glutamicibacter sp. JL.03c]